MTTYPEAYQMALGANVVVAIGNESACAGKALTEWALKNVDSIPEDARKIITHVVSHLTTIQEVATLMDDYYDEKLNALDESNPGVTKTIAVELADEELISKMQELAGMSQARRDEVRARNLANLSESN